MRYIADLHIHSCYSRATSKASRLPGLAAWAAIKGIQVLGTGDFTHPGWFAHLRKHLVPAEDGMFALAAWDREEIAALVPPGIDVDRLDLASIRFVLSAEISSIYKKDGRVRKIHNILYAPDFASVQRINAALSSIGNLESDGRPILGLDARDLLAITLDAAPNGFFVPAHIWTPWFSLFGSKSGFDDLEECFGDLSTEIFALETGLSSDPDMNRCVSALDRYTLISNSDCHSPAKLGREANIFATELSFAAMKEAIRTPVDAQGQQRFAATIEFYPEEGKYHCDGHRKCNICLEPDQSSKLDDLCPVCGRPLTIGVLHRVMDLADRDQPWYPDTAPAVHSLIPLPEILSELHGVGPATKTVLTSYAKAVNTFGSEFTLLLDTPIEEIRDQGSPLLAEAIARVRENRVIREPGYDGAFGVIRVFDPDELSRLSGQLNLFGQTMSVRKKRKKSRVGRSGRKTKQALSRTTLSRPAPDAPPPLNSQQQAIVNADSRHVLVQAGPGTGKTHTLIARLLHQLKTNPGPATVITFTNKAAREIQERVERDIEQSMCRDLFIATLHGFCLRFLRLHEPRLQVAGPETRTLMLKKLLAEEKSMPLLSLSANISELFSSCGAADETEDSVRELGRRYACMLDAMHLIDLDAIVPCALNLLKQGGQAARAMRRQAGFLYIDEFQDLNRAQYLLVQELANHHPDTSGQQGDESRVHQARTAPGFDIHSASIFAIGDPDQAIYGFRGADRQWFFHFARELQPACFHLDRNYRCGSHILKAAARVIAGNPDHGPEPRAAREETGMIQVQACAHPRAEARQVVRLIEELLGGTSHREIDTIADQPEESFSLRDICVLYRTGRQADVLAQALHEQGIPFQRVDCEPFYLHKPVLLLVEWLLTLTGRADLSHLLDLLSHEKGIGSATLDQVEEALGESPAPVADFLTFAARVDRLRPVADKIDQIRQQVTQTAAEHDLGQALVQLAELLALDADHPEVIRFVDLAASVAETLESLATYLLDNSATIFNDVRTEAVSLMTLHAAKGVEFPVVFITGMEEGTLPLAPRGQLSQAAFQAHMEEERRLCYVGMTRAKQRLYCTWSKKGGISRTGDTNNSASRFLADIPAELIQKAAPAPARRKRFRQLSLF